MTKLTRKSLVGLVFLLIVAVVAFYLKTKFLPMLHHPSLHQDNTLSNVLFVGSLFGLLFLMMVIMYEGKKKTKAHGSAHFATKGELKTYGTLATTPRKEQQSMSQALTLGDLPVSKLYLGVYLRKLIVLDERLQESHVFILAPTGLGKTSRVIIPALLREYGHRSLFVNDTKGELVEKTLGHLSHSHHCLVFAPTNPRLSCQYNPLAHIHMMEDAEALATCLIDNTGTSREAFWNSAPKLLVAATVLHLHETEPNAPFSRLIDILCGTKMDTIKTMFSSSKSPIAQKVITAFFGHLQKNDRLEGSIMVEMQTRFFGFHNPAIQEVTRSNDLDFTRMVDDPTVLFLSIPEDEASRLEPLSACLIMQMMSALVRRATRSPHGRLPRDFAFYLDEFCNAGVIPNFTKYISTVRSRGIAFLLAVQDFGQLRSTYGENERESILANCSTHLVFPGCGLQETRYYSEKLGKTTVETVSSSDRGDGSFFIPSTRTYSYGETHRELMTPDELRTMEDGTLLVFISKYHPLLVQNTAYYEDPALLERVNLPGARPAARVTVTPAPPPPPAAGLPSPKAAPSGPASGPRPTGPKPPPPQTGPDNSQFYSPD